MPFGSEVFFALVTLVALRKSSFFFQEPSVWEPCPPTIRKVKLVDGTMDRHELMRRKVNGRWEYRRMTAHEATQTMVDLEIP
jgi:hypothetical protein